MTGVVVEGPLAPWADGFLERLDRLGYKQRPAEKHMALLAQLSGWLVGEGISPGELTAERVAEFLSWRRRSGRVRLVTLTGAGVLLGYLRELKAVPEASRPAPAGPVDVVMGRYVGFLAAQRGLSGPVVGHYEVAARLLLGTVEVLDDRALPLTASTVSRFVVDSCARPVKLSPRTLTSALRSFLRFCHLEGLTEVSLVGAVPSYASWRASSLPQPLPPAQTARLLASCDRRTSAGRRDYAVLVCLVRLGLRAGEVAGLRLDDIDWRAGEMVIHGKGPRVERLPLPADVGEAIAGYLRRGRPDVEDRAVFVRSIAPLVGLTNGGVTWVVYDACGRAGIARVGAHRLRHSAASDMLRAGGSLPEIGQVLRHRRPGTTAIYVNPRKFHRTRASQVRTLTE